MRYVFLFLLLLSGAFVQAQEPKLMLPIGHSGEIVSGVFSTDGKKILTASADSTAKVWDANTGILLASLEGHSARLYSAEFSPDNSKIVTASSDGTARVWDAVLAKQLAILKGHTSTILFEQFSPDNTKIVTASDDHTARIWSASGNLLGILKGHASTVVSAQFSHNGEKIVTASHDGTAMVWEVASGRLLLTLYKDWYNLSVNTAQFSSDDSLIVTASLDYTARIWNATSGKQLAVLRVPTSNVTSAQFSVNNLKIVTAANDNSAHIWSISGELLSILNVHDCKIITAKFSPDNTKVVTTCDDNTVRVWSSGSGKQLAVLKHNSFPHSAQFSPDNTKIVTTSEDGTACLWNAASNQQIALLQGHTSSLISTPQFSQDNNKIVTAFGNSTSVWNFITGKQLSVLQGDKHVADFARFSPDNTKIVATFLDSTACVWNAVSGKQLSVFKYNRNFKFGRFSPDNTKILTSLQDDTTALIWDAVLGKQLAILQGHIKAVESLQFSPDSKKVVMASYDKTALVWNTLGILLIVLRGHNDAVNSAQFSTDGTKIVTASKDGTARVWDAVSGKPLAILKGNMGEVNSAWFSQDNKMIVTTDSYSWFSDSVRIWEVASGRQLAVLQQEIGWITSVQFSPDLKTLLTASLSDGTFLWEAASGKKINIFPGGNLADFSRDGTKILTLSADNTCKLWNTETGELLYTFFAVDSTDYLVVDKYNRYDGTEAARKLLYFTCGTEVISLDQVKDSLWVPNLAERIMRGEPINSPKLSDLNLCGLTPLVEQQEDSNKNIYTFNIIPRRGGLGETVLSINGIEIKRYGPQQLLKKGAGYQFKVSRAEVQPYFASVVANNITVKAYTTGNSISSRGVTVLPDTASLATARTPPNLYAIMVGVSDYKGDALDLKYAAKDAEDLSNAVASAAGKLLGGQHVFMYNVNTGSHRTGFPEKATIRQAFADIGKKATANDILLLFFAGHGVMEGQKKQFYFLTADASKDGDVAGTGISIDELTEWMKPSSIRAQKRILIFDACNSGQAINELITMRSDEESNRIKAIEKLNERSGLLILSASASNQSAYELGRYNQGLLTYALLKAIKEQPEILDANRYLNVSKWFGAAEKTVTDIVRETGVRQQPQIAGLNSFNIGLVDNEVIAGITLPMEKPLFTGSNFINLTVGDDDIDVTKAVNNLLYDIAERGSSSGILYLTATNSPDAYSLTGTYEVKGEEVLMKINIKQKGSIRHRFEARGKTTALPLLAAEVWKGVEAWIKTSK